MNTFARKIRFLWLARQHEAIALFGLRIGDQAAHQSLRDPAMLKFGMHGEAENICL